MSKELNSEKRERETGLTYSSLGARGGPLFLPGLVSPYVNAREFQYEVTDMLDNIQKELADSMVNDNDVDISVDDLKIQTDDEILDQVFREAFEGPDHSGGCPDSMSEEMTNRENRVQDEDKMDGTVCLTGACTNSSNNSVAVVKNKKRGRSFDRDARAAELESEEFSKAESLAMCKRQKDEEKGMAQLHCLKYKANEKSVTRSERQERLKALKFITSNLKAKPVNQSEFQPVRHPEVVMCVEFYHNFRRDHKVQEFLVLASQPLTALRDKLYCLTDQLMQKAQQHAPSGYFLIENVFYNDLRDPNATNYSKPIIDWLSNNRDEALQKWKAVVGSGLRKDQKPLFQSSVPSDRLPYFRAADMATTCFADLRCRLGVCYLYCHQGDCKHNIVIRDMRLLDSQDVQNKMAYPLLTFQPRVRHRKCNICDIYRAKKVTYDDKFAPKNPSYFCDCCYYLLHYSSDGYLLYDDFRAYDYYHE